MERKLPGKMFRKFGYTSRGCPLFWKCQKVVITGAVNRKMLFHSLLEVAGNSNRKFWLNGKRPLPRSKADRACSQTADVWVQASRKSLPCSLILSCIDLPVSPM